ncbi:hypothetical protein R3W88_004171 [Solanum pinnatisectum]|uniref:Reverse transcriptase n=1 Tax=Solanum pinnatisectum TaxID=50273 RepID=A0AAV9K8I3_9SOLN|nr:hypothetical protein R3W88_004171 [Solanum pinnatisectum]
MQASKICHLPHEEELVQTLIRSLDGNTTKLFLKNSLDERNIDASTSIPLKQSNQNTEQIHAIFDSCDMRFKPYNPRVSQLKVRKPRTFTPLMETLTSIFQRLWVKGLLKPREGWIPKHSSSTMLLSTCYCDLPNIHRLICLTIRHWAHPPYNTTLGLSALQYVIRLVHLTIRH